MCMIAQSGSDRSHPFGVVTLMIPPDYELESKVKIQLTCILLTVLWTAGDGKCMSARFPNIFPRTLSLFPMHRVARQKSILHLPYHDHISRVHPASIANSSNFAKSALTTSFILCEHVGTLGTLTPPLARRGRSPTRSTPPPLPATPWPSASSGTAPAPASSSPAAAAGRGGARWTSARSAAGARSWTRPGTAGSRRSSSPRCPPRRCGRRRRRAPSRRRRRAPDGAGGAAWTAACGV